MGILSERDHSSRVASSRHEEYPVESTWSVLPRQKRLTQAVI